MDELQKLIKISIEKFLSESDWSQLPDSGLTLSQQIAWMEYRQALRDLVATNINPGEIIFPIKPEG